MKRFFSAGVLSLVINTFFALCITNRSLEAASTGADYADKYIDLHLHLDGALTVEIAKQLAELQGILLPADDDEELDEMLSVPEDCESLNDFLECFELPHSLMQTPEGLSEAVRLVAENIQSQGVIYAEFRFAPQLHTNQGMTHRKMRSLPPWKASKKQI